MSLLARELQHIAGSPDDFRMPVEWRETILQAAKVCEAAEDFRELRAKLPHTADHVAVVPHADSVWYVEAGPRPTIRRLWDWRWIDDQGCWVVADRRANPEVIQAVSDCYSTWQRARKAQRRQTG